MDNTKIKSRIDYGTIFIKDPTRVLITKPLDFDYKEPWTTKQRRKLISKLKTKLLFWNKILSILAVVVSEILFFTIFTLFVFQLNPRIFHAIAGQLGLIVGIFMVLLSVIVWEYVRKDEYSINWKKWRRKRNT